MIEDDLQRRIITLEVEREFFLTRISSLENEVSDLKQKEIAQDVFKKQKSMFVELVKRDWPKIVIVMLSTLLFFGDIVDAIRDFIDKYIFH